jgi:S-DNA-T family DNA segregation ATPase FtsK/SpoIIIE
MAKKKSRKSSRRSSRSVKQQPEHTLPAGFWGQVGAVLLVVLSLLLVVAWFGVGGPVLEWLQQSMIATVGYAVYVVPLAFTYLAYEVFKSETSRSPFAVKMGTFLTIAWFAGLFGLMKDATGKSDGGFVGDTVNSGMLALVSPGIAAFIYIVFIFLTLLFTLRISPFAVFNWLWRLVQTRPYADEQGENVKVMRKAAEADDSMGEFKLNASVPMVDPNEKKSGRLSTLRGSVQQDKAAEERSALVTVSDPNWKAPSLDLLEKKQSPADAGDVQHNAQIIKDTLAEFSIDVEMEGANIGPKVTQYTLKPPSGVKLTRITALETNIALNLAAQSLRIEAPIPGQRAVGIEVPNRKAADVRLRGILESKQWTNASEPLSFAIGKDISGEAVVGQLNKMPHLLIAGQTGSGKSMVVCSSGFHL